MSDKFMTPPVEWKSRQLVFYLIDGYPLNYAIRLPDGFYIEVQWANKYRVSGEIYDEIYKITDNMKTNFIEAQELVNTNLSNLEQQDIRDITIPITPKIVWIDRPFTRFDSLIAMIPPNFLIKEVKDNIYLKLFDLDPPDEFKGISGLWSKSQPPRSEDGIFLTGRYNTNGVLIL